MKMTEYVKGITITEHLLSSRLGVLSIDENMPLDKQELCPGCLNRLSVLCTLIDGKVKTKIHVGCCEKCGYIGYIDRPTREWIVSFYSHNWDKKFIRKPEEIRAAVRLPKEGFKGTRYRAFKLREKAPIDKEKSFLDIGSGYGQIMKNFSDAGWKNVYGIENSPHRAELVKKIFGFSVINGDFGSKEAEEELKKYAPFGLIFSHHVFEHIYNPGEAVASLSRLQEEGDYAIIALPNAAGEHINYATLYLPHLHGFTRESLEALFNRHGYEVVDSDFPDISNTIILFKKTKNPKKIFQLKDNYLLEAQDRIRQGFQLNAITEEGEYELRWEQKFNIKDTATLIKKPKETSRFLSEFVWYIRQCVSFVKSRIFKRFTGYYIFRIRPLYGDRQDNELEIHFKGPIKLLIK